MSKLALQLIEEARINKKLSLDLAKTGLKDIPEEVFELVWLEELILSDFHHEWDDEKDDMKWNATENIGNSNHLISFPEGLKKLKSLKKLVAGGSNERQWHIDNINILKNLTNLTHLYLSSNQIVDITPLENLKKLEQLSLTFNLIKDISSLEKLNNLTSLNLGHNKISNISSLASLKKITQLNLVENLINDARPLEGLVRLVHLFLSGNQIKDLYRFRNLTNLSILSLAYNKIKEILFISDLKNLKDLDLSNNLISDISPITSLMKLEKLNFRDNNISNIFCLIVPMSDDVPVLLNANSWDADLGIFIDNNPIEYPPINIVEQGNDAIRMYFDENPAAMSAGPTLNKAVNNKQLDNEGKNASPWLNLSIKIGLIIGILTGFSFQSFWTGIVATFVAILIMLVFNPKRVFLNAAYFSLAAAGYNAIPFLKGNINFRKQLGDSSLDLQLNLGEGTSLGAAIILVLLAAFLFHLHSKQNP